VTTYNFTRDLSYGMNNSEVKDLQIILKSKGYLAATPNSNFGPQTLAAVKAYQVANGLPATGLVGPATRALLNEVPQATTSATISVPSAVGNSLAERLAGRMLLRVGSGGAIGYVDPRNFLTYQVTWLNALPLFEARALGISEINHALIRMEGSTESLNSFTASHLGYLFLRVENRGAITYIDMEGYGHNVTWVNLMSLFQGAALGITEDNYTQLPAGTL
jgi:hypothetical protein